MPPGDTADWGAWLLVREPDHMSAVVASLFHPVLGVRGSRANTSELVVLLYCAGGGGSTRSLWFDRGLR